MQTCHSISYTIVIAPRSGTLIDHRGPGTWNYASLSCKDGHCEHPGRADPVMVMALQTRGPASRGCSSGSLLLQLLAAADWQPRDGTRRGQRHLQGHTVQDSGRDSTGSAVAKLELCLCLTGSQLGNLEATYK